MCGYEPVILFSKLWLIGVVVPRFLLCVLKWGTTYLYMVCSDKKTLNQGLNNKLIIKLFYYGI